MDRQPDPKLSPEDLAKLDQALQDMKDGKLKLELPPRENYEEQQEWERQKMLHPTDDFCCPHCYGTEYKAKTDNDGRIGPGGRFWVTNFICLGCSAIFGDPVKFTTTMRWHSSLLSYRVTHEVIFADSSNYQRCIEYCRDPSKFLYHVPYSRSRRENSLILPQEALELLRKYQLAFTSRPHQFGTS